MSCVFVVAMESTKPALRVGGAFAPFERFGLWAKTSAQAEFISAEHFKFSRNPEKERDRTYVLSLSFSGAGDEARTRYLHLGKVALYQMSYTCKRRMLL